MDDMVNFPYFATRKGSQNLYYKRHVPPDLHADGRPKQIWRSLKTSDQKEARGAYAKVHHEIETQFEEWRQEGSLPLESEHRSSPASSANKAVYLVSPLTPALLRKLTDDHYRSVYEADFEWRGELWKKAQDDRKAFWRGDIIAHPEDDWHHFKGQKHSYYAFLMEEPELKKVFLYCISCTRKEKLQQIRSRYKLGDCSRHEKVVDDLLASKSISLPDYPAASARMSAL